MSYENAVATKLLATHCCCCGRSLVDATSVELGIGPECRNGATDGIDEQQRTLCNKLTYQAALAAQQGQVEIVRQCAEAIRNLGLENLADKVESRFVNAEKSIKIVITEANNLFYVSTPYKRSMGAEFASSWRKIQGRRWMNNKNVIPITDNNRQLLWQLLKTYFPGHYGKGPKGVFRVPTK